MSKTTPLIPTPIPYDGFIASHKTGEVSNMTPAKISTILGFNPNGDPSGDGKVVYEWLFTFDGHECAMWDYKGGAKYGEFSTYGPSEVFIALFGSDWVKN